MRVPRLGQTLVRQRLRGGGGETAALSVDEFVAGGYLRLLGCSSRWNADVCDSGWCERSELQPPVGPTVYKHVDVIHEICLPPLHVQLADISAVEFFVLLFCLSEPEPEPAPPPVQGQPAECAQNPCSREAPRRAPDPGRGLRRRPAHRGKPVCFVKLCRLDGKKCMQGNKCLCFCASFALLMASASTFFDATKR